MLKYIFHITLILFLLGAFAPEASAQLGIGSTATVTISGQNISAMNSLIDGVHKMTEIISDASKEMMKIGDMLICNANHGEAATYKFEVVGFEATVDWVALDIWISGWVFYILGFFISIITSFYMFDIAFNLSFSLVLLPLALALWPFAWTRGKLKTVVESIAYYTGLFIFLPMGILIGAELILTVIQNAFIDSAGAEISIKEVFDADKSDIIRDNLGVFSWTFVKVLISYLVAIRIVPLMADTFCTHFFGSALLGSPMNEKLTQVVALINQKTLGKALKFGKDATLHKMGTSFANSGKRQGGFLGRVMERYGKQIANRRK